MPFSPIPPHLRVSLNLPWFKICDTLSRNQPNLCNSPTYLTKALKLSIIMLHFYYCEMFYVHMMFLCLCIVSTRNKYNTIYFFSRIKSFFFYPQSSTERLPISMFDCVIFQARSGGNLIMSDLDLVGQIPLLLPALLGSLESKHKPIPLTNNSTVGRVFPLPAGPLRGQRKNRKLVKWKELLLLFLET